ncbi:MAG: PQQ-dependent sugar dehydrogenase [Pyrinomonadaceae bacterium]|nr:PQQ-dependent sugar dehydrogenase [Pyrinomonadaceae bacterium]
MLRFTLRSTKENSRRRLAQPDRANESSRLKLSVAPRLTPHRIALARNRTFDLYLPEDYDITVAAENLKRVRFMARSPENRIFVTDMHDRTDNRRGAVYILDDFDEQQGRFRKVTRYMSGLRNPNSIAFFTDRKGNSWFYLALTDRLLRYHYTPGETAPTSEPQTLATFPDEGLSYKYGGWHLTRTIAISANNKLYVSVGSSCNACVEKEEVRASIIEMDMNGDNKRFFARGLRNAVGLKWIQGRLFATNMGADHLGGNRPDDTMFVVRENTNYGWPYCYQFRTRNYADNKFNSPPRNFSCRNVPAAFASFSAHSSPLGFEYFNDSSDQTLANSFLVALHGSSNLNLHHGYSIAQVREDGGAPQDFIRGFQEGRSVHGRTVDILRTGDNSFLFTDDTAGVIYYVRKK